MKFKKSLLIAALGLSLPVAAFGQTVNINTGFDTVNGIAQFDWGASNVIAIGGNQAFLNFLTDPTCPTGSCNFDVYVQGRLNVFVNSANGSIASGLGTSYEITYVAAFQEKVKAAALNFGSPGANLASFGFIPSVLGDGSPNFFKMFVDGAQNANDLAGTGFTDGSLVLQGTIAPSGGFTSSFLTTGNIVDIGGATATTPCPAWYYDSALHIALAIR